MNILYFLLGIIVNFIWGFAFLIPYYLRDIDPVLIVLSRYFFLRNHFSYFVIRQTSTLA